MHFTRFIAKRIGPTQKKKNNMSDTALKIALSAVSLGLAVMLISVSVVTGYKKEIYRKIMGFESHITITNRSMNTTYETKPFDQRYRRHINRELFPELKHIQAYATKPAIISNNNEIQGVVMKGVGADYNREFVEKHLECGKMLPTDSSKRSYQIVISRKLANILNVKLGDKLHFYFIQDPPAVRAFSVCGIYNTGIQTIDASFALCDIRQIQRLNRTDENMVSGLEVQTYNINQIESLTEKLRRSIGAVPTEEGNLPLINSFKDNNPAIIQWLQLTDVNVEIIITLMIIVAVFNMISGLLIIILERTSMIGILKALGASNFHIKKIFMYNGMQLVFRGILWGNILGISILVIQKYGKLIPLDPSIYYVDTVPVNLNILNILLLNAGTALAGILALLLPTLIISTISPSKTIKFN